jgi:hypothetical protein
VPHKETKEKEVRNFIPPSELIGGGSYEDDEDDYQEKEKVVSVAHTPLGECALSLLVSSSKLPDVTVLYAYMYVCIQVYVLSYI